MGSVSNGLDPLERLVAIEEIKTLKARYFRLWIPTMGRLALVLHCRCDTGVCGDEKASNGARPRR